MAEARGSRSYTVIDIRHTDENACFGECDTHVTACNESNSSKPREAGWVAQRPPGNQVLLGIEPNGLME